MAQDRANVEEAYPGDIIGIHNHGTIQIGDTFSEGEPLQFTGIPNFAPEHFRRVRVKNSLKIKQLQKGLAQLSEEGAVRIPLSKTTLEGHLAIPPGAQSLVVFAHGSGSGRFSPRNLFVSDLLLSDGLATLLCDLLTREEEEVDAHPFLEHLH